MAARGPSKDDDESDKSSSDDDEEEEEDQEEVKDKQVRLVTRAMLSENQRKEFLATTLVGIFLQIVYLVSATVFCSSLITTAMYQLNKNIENEFVLNTFYDSNGYIRNFGTIQSYDQIFSYAQNRFIPSTFNCQLDVDVYPSHEAPINMFHNLFTGSIRVRQLRMSNTSCSVWKKVSHMKKICTANFDEREMSKRPFGPIASSAWVYQSHEVTRTLSSDFKYSSYPGGGYMVDLPRNITEALDVVEDLKQNAWIDRQTRAVFLQVTLYNTNTDLIAQITAAFELLASGHISKTFAVNSVRLETDRNAALIICQALYVALNIIYIIRCVREFLYFGFRIYMKMIWNHVDTVIAVVSFMAIFLEFYGENKILPEQIALQRKHPNQYFNLEYSIYVRTIRNQLIAIGIFLVYIRTFQYMNFNRTTNQLNTVVRKSFHHVFMFFVLFAIIMATYSLCGFLMFCDVSRDFSTVGLSMFSMIRLMFANIDYSVIAESSAIVGPLFCTSFIIIVTFILLNVFISILNCSYVEVRTELGSSESTELTLTDFIKQKLISFCKFLGIKFKSKTMKKMTLGTAEKGRIKTNLLGCGFSNLEIEMFFARYNIDPLAEVGDYTLDELRDVMKSGSPHSPASQTSQHFMNREMVIFSKEDFKTEGAKLEKLNGVLEILHDRMNELTKEIEKAEKAVQFV